MRHKWLINSKEVPAKTVLVLLIHLFLTQPFLHGQSFQDFYQSQVNMQSADSNKLFFDIHASAFFDNHEYNGKFARGYTLTGSFIRPELSWQIGPKTRIRGGIYALKYSGREKLEQLTPVFSIDHRFNEFFRLTIGQIQGSVNHHYAVPIYAFNRFFHDNLEEGLQFKLDTDHFDSDIFLNWRDFIVPLDTFPEQFDVGFTGSFCVNPDARIFQVSFPWQLLATHQGGQIDNSGKPVQTFVNSAGGLQMKFLANNPLLKSFGLRVDLMGFHDFSPKSQARFSKGRAFYPKLFIDYSYFYFEGAYWRANRFLAPRGNPLYQSVGFEGDTFDERELWVFRLLYNRKLSRGIILNAGFRGYYDPRFNDFEHVAGLHLVVNERIFITGVND